MRDRVLAAFAAEAGALGAAMSTVTEAEWQLGTRCPPWTVAGLFGHVIVTVDRVPGMLAAPPPAAATVDAAGYYRPDERFSPATNAARIAAGTDRAATPATLVTDFTTSSGYVTRACASQPADRVVRTRHGDAMPLTDFLLTRVVEVAVHGLDLAIALGRPAWTTPRAAAAVAGLLLGDPDAPPPVGWDRLTFIRKATGRARMTDPERAAVAREGIRWLALG